MSRMRKELFDTELPSMGYESAYFRVLQAVALKRSLIHGRLHAGNGHSCAIGCAFDDGVKSLPTIVVDEIAEYNDSFPKMTEKQRWTKVIAWLRFKTYMMRKKKNGRR